MIVSQNYMDAVHPHRIDRKAQNLFKSEVIVMGYEANRKIVAVCPQ